MLLQRRFPEQRDIVVPLQLFLVDLLCFQVPDRRTMIRELEERKLHNSKASVVFGSAKVSVTDTLSTSCINDDAKRESLAEVLLTRLKRYACCRRARSIVLIGFSRAIEAFQWLFCETGAVRQERRLGVVNERHFDTVSVWSSTFVVS